jgi:hypothetical protein
MRTSPEVTVPTDEKQESCQQDKNMYWVLKWRLDVEVTAQILKFANFPAIRRISIC